MEIFLNKSNFKVEISFKNFPNLNFFFARPFLRSEKNFSQIFFGFLTYFTSHLKKGMDLIKKCCPMGYSKIVSKMFVRCAAGSTSHSCQSVIHSVSQWQLATKPKPLDMFRLVQSPGNSIGLSHQPD